MKNASLLLLLVVLCFGESLHAQGAETARTADPGVGPRTRAAASETKKARSKPSTAYPAAWSLGFQAGYVKRDGVPTTGLGVNLVNRFGPAIAIGMEFGYTFTKFQSPLPFIGSFEQKVKTFGGGFLVRNYLAQGKPLEVFLETGISVVSAKTSVLLSSTGTASNLAFGAGLSPAVSYTVPGVRFVAYPGGLAFVKVLDGESDFDVGWFPTVGLEIVY